MFGKVMKAVCLAALGVANCQTIPEVGPSNKKCRVLSLSGGGSKGAYEVGVVNTVIHTLEAPENHYDVVSGVSVGGINTAAFTLFGEGEDYALADFLMNLWKNLHNSDVWRFWPDERWYNPVEPIYGKGGYLDDSPLFHFLMGVVEKMGNISKRRTFVSACDAESGAYQAFSLYDEPGAKVSSMEYKVSAVVGSASMPFIFPPRNMSEFGYPMQLIDGGSVWNNNMVTAIDECLKIDGITSKEQVEVDVIVLPRKTGGLEPMKPNTLVPDTIRWYQRNKEVKDQYKMMDEIVEFMNTEPAVNFRYYFAPQVPLLPAYEILEFGYENWTKPMIELG